MHRAARSTSERHGHDVKCHGKASSANATLAVLRPPPIRRSDFDEFVACYKEKPALRGTAGLLATLIRHWRSRGGAGMIAPIHCGANVPLFQWFPGSESG